MGFGKGLVEAQVGQGMALACQRYEAGCNSSGSLFAGENNYFGVRKNRFCHNSSQLRAVLDMHYRRSEAADTGLVKTRHAGHRCS